MKILQTCRNIAPFIFIPLIFTGCFRYFYKTHTRDFLTVDMMQRMQEANKYFIIHFPDSAVALANIKADKEKVEGDLVEISPEHKKYLNPDKKSRGTSRDPYTPRKERYVIKSKDRKNAFMEVHMYTDQPMQREQQHVSIPLSNFKRIDVYELDKEATNANHFLSIVGTSLLVGGAAVLITFAIACNCPQVYVKNDGDYQFVSGVYSGAVYSSLERTDYLPLDMRPATDNTYCIKIKNVEDEEQFINRMQLLQVQHPGNVRVLLDRHGKPLSYQKPQHPLSVTMNGPTDISRLVAATDGDMYQFDGQSGADGFSNVEMSFAKPAAAEKAKLVLHARNSAWSGYLYHSFAELFGTGYEKWRIEKDKSAPKEMEEWQKMQALPLMVYIEQNGQWELADYFAHTGNTASRDMIMELDVSGIQGNNIKVKLATAYRFWDLDFAGMDFSVNAATTTTVVNPSKAVKAGGESQQNLVNAVDSQYGFLASGEEMNIEYHDLPAAKEKSSYFFVATGYYHNTKKYEGKPQVETLLKFRNKGAFDRYSRLKYEELQSMLAKLQAGRAQ
jgi:hypothetical protein